jgi:putative alpha-1,2-mannosidase
MPDLIQTGNSSKRRSKASIDAAPAAEPRERFDVALKAIGQHKSKAELDAEAETKAEAEAEAEARLNKALSQFGSKE